MNETWQKCPVCNGSGLAYGHPHFSEVIQCPTCSGSRMVSIATGQPPYRMVTKTAISISDIINLDPEKSITK